MPGQVAALFFALLPAPSRSAGSSLTIRAREVNLALTQMDPCEKVGRLCPEPGAMSNASRPGSQM